jgi:hypothetical protein
VPSWGIDDGRLFAGMDTRMVSGGFDTTVMVWDTVGRRTCTGEPGCDTLESWWKALAGDDAAAAGQAIGSFIGASKSALPFLKDRLTPAAPVDAKQIAKLIAELDDEAFEARASSVAALERMSDRAEPALRKALADGPSLEARRRIQRLLEKLDAGRSPELLRSLLALEVLERIGSQEAQRHLRELAHGAAEAQVTTCAETAALSSTTRLPTWTAFATFPLAGFLFLMGSLRSGCCPTASSRPRKDRTTDW